MSGAYPGLGFGAFWARGTLSAMERACLCSVLQHGHELTLFSYDPIPNLPTGVLTGDAEEILPQSIGKHIIYNGKPDLAHFSDLFRYEMIARRNLVWVDADIMMISDADNLPYANIIVREEQGGFNNAILYFHDKNLREAARRAVMTKFDKELRWGETGPQVVRGLVEQSKLQAEVYGPSLFYPIEHYDIWKMLLPAYRDECAWKCREAVTVHLFNNILTTLGYWKEMAPPEGSYLNDLLTKAGLIGMFKDIYPRKIMERAVENFRLQQNGKALGIKTVVREFIPSIGRTIRHYRK